MNTQILFRLGGLPRFKKVLNNCWKGDHVRLGGDVRLVSQCSLFHPCAGCGVYRCASYHAKPSISSLFSRSRTPVPVEECRSTAWRLRKIRSMQCESEYNNIAVCGTSSSTSYPSTSSLYSLFTTTLSTSIRLNVSSSYRGKTTVGLAYCQQCIYIYLVSVLHCL